MALPNEPVTPNQYVVVTLREWLKHYHAEQAAMIDRLAFEIKSANENANQIPYGALSALVWMAVNEPHSLSLMRAVELEYDMNLERERAQIDQSLALISAIEWAFADAATNQLFRARKIDRGGGLGAIPSFGIDGAGELMVLIAGGATP